MGIQASISDVPQSSQVFSAQLGDKSAFKCAAGRQDVPQKTRVPPKHADNRLPGHVFFDRLNSAFGAGGTLGHKGSTRVANVRLALGDCIRWLRKNPRYNGVYGRMTVEQFAVAKASDYSRTTWWRLRRDLLKSKLIEYSDDGQQVYVDFAHWDEPVAHAQYNRTRENAKSQKADRRIALRNGGQNRLPVLAPAVFHFSTPPPPKPPVRQLESHLSMCPVILEGAGAPSVRSAPPAAASLAAPAGRPGGDLQKFTRSQHPTPAPKPVRPPEPEQAQVPAQATEPVLDVGQPERKLGKAGMVAKNYFLTLVSKLPPADPEPAPANMVVPKRMPPVVPSCPAMPDVKCLEAARRTEEQNRAGLTASTLGVINATFGLKLSWTKLRHTDLPYEHLRDAALYATMAAESTPKGWQSLEAIVINSAKNRTKGAWGGFKSRQTRR